MALKNYTHTFAESASGDMLELKQYIITHFYVVDEEKNAITVLRVLNEGRDWMKIIKDWLRKNGADKKK